MFAFSLDEFLQGGCEILHRLSANDTADVVYVIKYTRTRYSVFENDTIGSRWFTALKTRLVGKQ